METKHKESKLTDHKTRNKNRSRNEITVIITSSSEETRREHLRTTSCTDTHKHTQFQRASTLHIVNVKKNLENEQGLPHHFSMHYQ